MASNSDHELAARVVAWHNRHPLALRITAAMVQGMGVVALPFKGPEPAAMSAAESPLHETASADAAPAAVRSNELVAAFDEELIAPLKPGAVARFARRHGQAERPGAADWPQRDVLPGGTLPFPASVLYLRTAAIEVMGRRRRVLVGSAPHAVVMGRRLWSRPRLGAAVTLGLAGLAAGLAPLLLPDRPQPTTERRVDPVATTAGAAMTAASSASAALVSLPPYSSAASAAAVAPLATASMPAAVAVAAGASAADTSADAQPSLKPDLRPHLSAAHREAARRQVEALRGRDPGREVAQGGPAAVPIDASHNYALVTRSTRGRAASEVMLSLMASAAAGAAWPGQPRTEVLQVPQGWRAVWWPFGSIGDAEVARAALAQYGINAEIVEF